MFGTIPREFLSLASLVDWIAGGGDKEARLANLIADVSPAPDDDEIKRWPWLGAAWATQRNPMKSAAYLGVWWYQTWHEEESAQVDCTFDAEFGAFEDFTRKYVAQIRRCLGEAAAPNQVAGALSTLADVLNQEVGERTAAFIIELVGRAKLPAYLVNALFAQVAATEAGKIKPASFTRLLEVMEPRMRSARVASSNVQALADNLNPALAYLRERLRDDLGALPQ